MFADEDCYTGDGSTYQGFVSTTVNGKTCLNWSGVYSFLPSNNYCRNYFANFGFTEPVCYMVPGTYYVESCGVPKCGIKSYISTFSPISKFVKSKKMSNMCSKFRNQCVTRSDFKTFYLTLILFTDLAGKK